MMKKEIKRVLSNQSPLNLIEDKPYKDLVKME
jgi:hypothetical protein